MRQLKTGFIITISLLLCLVLCGIPTGAEEDSLSATIDAFVQTMEPISLHRLDGVYVLVEEIEPEAQKDGLAGARLQKDVELRLRRAGVQVLTEEEWATAPGGPFLLVDVNTLKRADRRPYVYSVHVKLMQQVTLERDSMMSFWATTWDEGALGIASAERLSDVQDSVRDLVDKFIRDYLAGRSR